MSLEQEVGRLQGAMEGLQNTCKSLEDSVRTLTEDVSALTLKVESVLSEGKGGWKVITILASVSVTVGAGITWLFTHITWK